MRYQTFLITKAFNYIDWAYWIIPNSMSPDNRESLYKKILFEHIMPFFPGIDLQTIKDTYGPESNNGLWFEYAYFFPHAEKDILLLVRKVSEGSDIAGRGIWKFAGIVLDSKQRSKKGVRSLLLNILNSPDLFILTDEVYKYTARELQQVVIFSPYYEILEDEKDAPENGILTTSTPALSRTFPNLVPSNDVALPPNRANLDYISGIISNEGIMIPYFYLGPYKKKEIVERRLPEEVTTDKRPPSPVKTETDEGFINMMPPEVVVDSEFNENPMASLGEERQNQTSENFEISISSMTTENSTTGINLEVGKSIPSPINILKTIPIQIAIKAYKLAIHILDRTTKG